MSLGKSQDLIRSRFWSSRDETDFEDYRNDTEATKNEKHALPSSKRQRSAAPLSSKKKADISENDRKFAWAELYGPILVGQQVFCAVCRVSPIGWGMLFEMAHVVPRALGGNNDSVWNRVPVCLCCNRNVAKYSNLFDVMASHFPSRIVPIAIYLQRCFSNLRPYFAAKHLKDKSLEQFVRLFYGQNASIEIDDDFERFLQNALPDYNEKHQNGRIQNEIVYESLQLFDSLRAEVIELESSVTQIEAEIDQLTTSLRIKSRLLSSTRTQIASFWPTTVS